MIKKVGLFLLWFVLASQQSVAQDAVGFVQPSVPNEYKIGPSNEMAFPIIVYSAFTCHVCSQFYLEVMPRIIKDFDNRFYFVMRPLPFNAIDMASAQMILHSRDPHGLAEIFYRKQKEWLEASNQLEALKSLAENWGMSKEEIENALRDDNLKRSLLARHMVLRAKTTPIFLVGKSEFPGLPDYDKYFKPALEKLVSYQKQGRSVKDIDILKEMKII